MLPEEEEEQRSDDCWPARLSPLWGLRCQVGAVLPTCAPDCVDGEQSYRALGAWSVPWTSVPKASFLAQWWALPAERRQRLLAECYVYANELEENGEYESAWQNIAASALRRDDDATLVEFVERLHFLPTGTGITPMSRFMAAAAFHGAVRCLEYLISLICLPSALLMLPVCSSAVQGGRLQCLRLLHRLRLLVLNYRSIGYDLIAIATIKGRLSCLRYLLDIRGGRPADDGDCLVAVRRGHFRCAQCLFEKRGLPQLEDARQCVREVVAFKELWGQRRLREKLQWLRDHSGGDCPWDADTCTLAVKYQNLAALQCLHELGCPWTEEATAQAAAFGDLECFRYLHEHGCPFDYDRAAESGHFECLQYLRENGGA